MTLAGSVMRLPRAAQQILAVVLLLMAGVFCWCALVAPLELAFHSQTAWRAAMRHRIATERGWLDSASRVTRLSQETAQSTLWSRLYAPQSATEFSSRLRRDGTTLVPATGASPTHIEELPVDTSDGLERAGVRVGLSPTIDQLQRLLSAIRAHRPYLRVQEIHVGAPQLQTRDTNAALTVTLDVVGYGGELDPALRANP